MADIVEITPKKPNKKRRAIVILVLAAFLLLLILVYTNRYNPVVNQLFGRVFNNGIEEKYQITALESGGKFEAGIFGDTLILQGPDGYTGYSKAGKADYTGNYYLANPVVKTNGRYVLTYDAGGRDCFLMDGKNVVRHVTTDADIICASANEQGIFAVAVDDASSLGRVLVYDRSAGQLYDWYSGNNYIVDVAVSPDGTRMAVCTISVTETGASSSIIMFQFSENKPFCTISKDDVLVTRVKFSGNGSVIAMGDNYVARYNDKGDQTWKYEYDGGLLKTFSFDDSDLMAFAVKNPQSVHSADAVLFLNENGKVVGTYESSVEADFVSCKNNMAMIVSGREIIVASKNGSELARTTVGRDVLKAYVWGPRDFAVITGNGVSLYQLH